MPSARSPIVRVPTGQALGQVPGLATPASLVWITRAEPGASATAARVASLGWRPLVGPLLTVRRLATPIDLTGVAALAFTSANGVEALTLRTARRDLRVFAVGDATETVARAAGFQDVISANGDGAALAALIVAARPAGVVLLPGPRQRAGDVVGALSRSGVTARRLDLYETEAATRIPDVVAQALAAGSVDVVLLHSPKAAEALARLMEDVDVSSVTAAGLSAACLRPLGHLDFARMVAASAPREDALLDALIAALGNPPHPR